MSEISKMIIICGYPGVGKSTIAQPLAKRLKYALLDIDDLKEMVDPSIVPDDDDRGRIAYSIFKNLVRKQVSLGNSVIIDVPFTYTWLRESMVLVAKEYNARMIIVYCWCRDEITLKRIWERFQSNPEKYGNRDETAFYRIKRNFVPIDAIVNLKVNTEDEPDRNVEKIEAYLNSG